MKKRTVPYTVPYLTVYTVPIFKNTVKTVLTVPYRITVHRTATALITSGLYSFILLYAEKDVKHVVSMKFSWHFFPCNSTVCLVSAGEAALLLICIQLPLFLITPLHYTQLERQERMGGRSLLEDIAATATNPARPTITPADSNVGTAAAASSSSQDSTTTQAAIAAGLNSKALQVYLLSIIALDERCLFSSFVSSQ